MTPQDLDTLLTGAQVTLYPYQRSVYGRDTLYWMWSMVEQEGTGATIFYTQACAREAERGDLVEFVRYFSEPTRFVLTVARRSDRMPIGLVWFDAVVGQRHGLIGLWYQRHTTPLAREGTRLATRYAFEVLGFSRLLGWTPWVTAVRHGLALGWQKIATIPGLISIAGKPHDVYVLRKEKRMDEPSHDALGTRVAPTEPCLVAREEVVRKEKPPDALPQRTTNNQPLTTTELATQLRALPAQLVRQWILDLEAFILTIPGVRTGNAYPLRHSFGDGLYMREIFIPAGYVFTGRIHKYMNPNFLMAGEALIATEQHGTQHFVAPTAVLAVPGEKRAVIAITDIWWITVHANPDDCTDTTTIEERIFAWDYAAFYRFQEGQQP